MSGGKRKARAWRGGGRRPKADFFLMFLSKIILEIKVNTEKGGEHVCLSRKGEYEAKKGWLIFRYVKLIS